jgi:hypothetical protein
MPAAGSAGRSAQLQQQAGAAPAAPQLSRAGASCQQPAPKQRLQLLPCWWWRAAAARQAGRRWGDSRLARCERLAHRPRELLLRARDPRSARSCPTHSARAPGRPPLELHINGGEQPGARRHGPRRVDRGSPCKKRSPAAAARLERRAVAARHIAARCQSRRPGPARGRGIQPRRQRCREDGGRAAGAAARGAVRQQPVDGRAASARAAAAAAGRPERCARAQGRGWAALPLPRRGSPATWRHACQGPRARPARRTSAAGLLLRTDLSTRLKPCVARAQAPASLCRRRQPQGPPLAARRRPGPPRWGCPRRSSHRRQAVAGSMCSSAVGSRLWLCQHSRATAAAAAAGPGPWARSCCQPQSSADATAGPLGRLRSRSWRPPRCTTASPRHGPALHQGCRSLQPAAAHGCSRRRPASLAAASTRATRSGCGAWRLAGRWLQRRQPGRDLQSGSCTVARAH